MDPKLLITSFGTLGSRATDFPRKPEVRHKGGACVQGVQEEDRCQVSGVVEW